MSGTTRNGTPDGSLGPCTSRRRTSPPRHLNDFRKVDPSSSLVEQAHQHAISTAQAEIARDPLTARRLTGTDDPARSVSQSVMTWSGGLPPNASYSWGKQPATTPRTVPVALTLPEPHWSKSPSARPRRREH